MIIENLKKKIGSFELICTHLNIEKGLYLLDGENGSGKTTLLRIISGLDTHYSGTIKIGSVSWYFQNKVINSNLSFKKNLFLIDKYNKSIVADLLNILNCEDLVNAPIHSLSIGEKQRLEIITVLAQKADVYILDEPFSALNESLIDKLIGYLSKLAKDHLIIITNHGKSDFSNKIEISNGKVTPIIGNTSANFPALKRKRRIHYSLFKYLAFSKVNYLLCLINLVFSFSILQLSFSFSSSIFNKINSKTTEDYYCVYEKTFSYDSHLDIFLEKEGIRYYAYPKYILISKEDYKNEWLSLYPALAFTPLNKDIISNVRIKFSVALKRIEKELRYCAVFSLFSTILYVFLLFKINYNKHKIFADLIHNYYLYLLSFYLFTVICSFALGTFINVLLKKLLLNWFFRWYNYYVSKIQEGF